MKRTDILSSVAGALALALLSSSAMSQPGNFSGLNTSSGPDSGQFTLVRGGGGGGGGGGHGGGFGGGGRSFSAGGLRGGSPMARSNVAPRLGARRVPNAFDQLYLLGRTPAQMQQNALASRPVPPTPAPNSRGRPMRSPPAPEAREQTPFSGLSAGGGVRRRKQSASMRACLQDWDPATQMSKREWAATCRRVGPIPGA